jgi:hypothetical protein
LCRRIEGDFCECVNRNEVKQSWSRAQTTVARKHVHFLQDMLITEVLVLGALTSDLPSESEFWRSLTEVQPTMSTRKNCRSSSTLTWSVARQEGTVLPSRLPHRWYVHIIGITLLPSLIQIGTSHHCADRPDRRTSLWESIRRSIQTSAGIITIRESRSQE